MNKRNVIELAEYKENKIKVTHEQECLEVLDRLSDKIELSKTYASNFNKYLDCMVRDDKIKRNFANNLRQQVSLMMMTASASLNMKEKS